MSLPQAQFPASQRSSYQFPVYRWIGWLTVAGYVIGLTVMFFISGMFGVPAPIGWAALVILFTAGMLLLDRPKALLNFMMFYFLLMPGNRLLGLVGVPLPSFIDELFFLPFIAVIAMNWIQRRQLREATLFPLAFCLIAAMSWYVNGRPSLFTAAQVTMIMLKSYIIWYFCRLTCTFEDERQFSRWAWIYIAYAFIQYFYNILWQRGFWPRWHPDFSGGVFGPDGTGGAHIVGYISVFALLLLGGWWISVGNRVAARRRFWAGICAVVIAYNFIFMTDTKHALLIFPAAAILLVMHPKLSMRMRMRALMTGLLFIFFSVVYFILSTGGVELRRTWEQMRNSPKGEIMYAVTRDFSYLVPYPLLGAGPGRFGSPQGVAARSPLARRYIIPEVDALRRTQLTYRNSGNKSGFSMVGKPQSDFLTLMGEFGWLGTLVYYSFMGWVGFRLFQKSVALPLEAPSAGLLLGLSCSVIFLMFTTLIVATITIPVVVFPVWMLIGRAWDMTIAGPPAFDGKTRP